MKSLIKIALLLVSFSSLFFFFSCDDEPGEDPQPTSLIFKLTAATFNGSPIEPLPDFTLTLNFDADGNPSGFSYTGNAVVLPISGTNGTWAYSSGLITFTSGDNSKIIATSNPLTPQTTSTSFTWSLTKIDDGVEARQQGEYVYTLALE